MKDVFSFERVDANGATHRCNVPKSTDPTTTKTAFSGR